MRVSKQQFNRYWDFATLGKFKWYLCGVFFLLVASRLFGLMEITTPHYRILYQRYESRQIWHLSEQGLLWYSLYDKWYDLNPALYWNYVWINSDFWRPVGMTLSGIVIFLFLVAYLRGE